MEDWKSGLRQAADKLQLDSKAKAEALTSTPTPAVKTTLTAITSERPATLPMPGYPASASVYGAAPVKARELTNPVQKLARKPAIPQAALSITSRKKRVRPLPPPVRCPYAPANPKNVLPHRGRPVPTANAKEPHVKPQFSPPDMARYKIRHGAADASLDQSWEDAGIALVLRESEKRGRAQCTLGLDFGTAFTKACVQFRQSTFVIHWDRAVPHCAPCLLPGLFTVKQDEVCVLGSAPGGHVRGDLKMGLLNGASEDSRINATAYWALVTRYIRSWLFAQHASVFSGFQLEWFMNVGLPAVPWDNLQLRGLYQSIALAGWDLGTASGKITIAAAASAFAKVQGNASRQSGQLPRERVKAFPEFVAQINSYRKSPRRRRDLHLLVDVGAGTVDIVTFHVWEPNEEDCYSILDASVESRGTHVLLGYRASAGELEQTEWEEASARLPVRDFEFQFRLSNGKLDPVQRHFVEQFLLALEKVLRNTKARRYGTSPAWQEGVPFFICGGGRDVDAYREAIRKVQAERHMTEISLPWPEGLVPGKLQSQDFHRVSVAHGLSYAAENIGQIERKSEVPDLYRSGSVKVDNSDRYIEK